MIHDHTGSLKLAQKQLRHSNISTTADIYVEVDSAGMRKNAEVLGKAFESVVVNLWEELIPDQENVH